MHTRRQHSRSTGVVEVNRGRSFHFDIREKCRRKGARIRKRGVGTRQSTQPPSCRGTRGRVGRGPKTPPPHRTGQAVLPNAALRVLIVKKPWRRCARRRFRAGEAAGNARGGGHPGSDIRHPSGCDVWGTTSAAVDHATSGLCGGRHFHYHDPREFGCGASVPR
jgi:hypothetical protein